MQWWEYLDKSCPTWELSRWRWNSYSWALCTWWYFSSSRCFKVRILQNARLQTRFKYSSIPEMCFFTWGFQLDMLFCNCHCNICWCLPDVRRGLEHPSSFVEREVRRCPSCPWLTWWFSAVNGRCDRDEAIQWSQHRVRTLAVAITNRHCDLQSFGSRRCGGLLGESIWGDGGIYPTRNFTKVNIFHTVNPFHPHRSVHGSVYGQPSIPHGRESLLHGAAGSSYLAWGHRLS